MALACLHRYDENPFHSCRTNLHQERVREQAKHRHSKEVENQAGLYD